MTHVIIANHLVVTLTRSHLLFNTPIYNMSTAATLVTPREGALSTPSENGNAPESDTSLEDSATDSEDKLLLAQGA